jgi:5-methylthioadenosine/S-adenosylhomocysteine deaminase
MKQIIAWLVSTTWGRIALGASILSIGLVSYFFYSHPSSCGTFKHASPWKELECLEDEATRYGAISAGAVRVEDYNSPTRAIARAKFREDLAKVRSLPDNIYTNEVHLMQSEVAIAAAINLASKTATESKPGDHPKTETSPEDYIKKLKELLPGDTLPKLNSSDEALARLARLRYLQNETENLDLPPLQNGYRRLELSVSLTAWTKGNARAAVVYLDLYPFNADRWCHWTAHSVEHAYLQARTDPKIPVKLEDFLVKWRAIVDSEYWSRKRILDESTNVFPGLSWHDVDFWGFVKHYENGPNQDPYANCHTALESRHLLPNLVYVEPVANPRFALSATAAGSNLDSKFDARVPQADATLSASRKSVESDESADLEVNVLSFAAGQRRAGWIFLQNGNRKIMRPFESRVHMVVDVPAQFVGKVELDVHKTFLDQQYRPLVTFSDQTRWLNLARQVLNEIESEPDRKEMLSLRWAEKQPWNGEVYSSVTNWQLLKSWTRNLGGLAWSEKLVFEIPGPIAPRGYAIYTNVVGLGATQHQLAYVAIEADKVRGIYPKREMVPPEFKLLEDDFVSDYLYPGLVDLHNHPNWNFIPRWSIPIATESTCRPKFCNRYEWQKNSDYKEVAERPFQLVKNTIFAMDGLLYGDARALLGGVTTLQGGDDVGGSPSPMRRLWSNTISNARAVTKLRDDNILAEYESKLSSQEAKRLFLHVGEGTDADSRGELDVIEAAHLLRPQTVLIHGVAFGHDELEKIKKSGASMVWSPRSNLALYGATLDIEMVLAKDIPVALAPDWALTGSSNMFQELRCAAEYAERNKILGLTPERLFRMVTSDAARIAGLVDSAGEPTVGVVRESAFADFILLRHRLDDPYKNLLQARDTDIHSVILNGRPVLGDKQFLQFAYGSVPVEYLTLSDGTKIPGYFGTEATSYAVNPIAVAKEHLFQSALIQLAPFVEMPSSSCSVARR